MLKTRTGISSLKINGISQGSNSSFLVGRVNYIILDNVTNTEIFNENGSWQSIGTILFEEVDDASSSPLTSLPARPLFPNIKIYPLVNEIVYIISLPDSDQSTSVHSYRYYYFQPVNIFNNNHHNALPNISDSLNIPLSQDVSYEQSQLGLVSRVTSNPTEINLGDTFTEKNNIKPNQPFEGDITYEGRWGQSLRFGSTVQNSKIFNPWSNSGLNGDPITILKNDQYNDGKDAWIPQVENVNLNKSSIYLTSTQQIPIEVASKKYKSYETGLEPKLPNLYSDSQIILNSGRLLFNSYDDSILLSSNDSINLNAQETVNVDAEEGFSVSVGKEGEVLLGSSDFEVVEPVILGDKFLSDVEALANILVDLGNNFELNPMLTSDETSNAALLNIGGELKQSALNILNNLENYKSKVTFSK